MERDIMKTGEKWLHLISKKKRKENRSEDGIIEGTQPAKGTINEQEM